MVSTVVLVPFISILTISFFAVGQVKKVGKSVKVTSQKSQVSKPKKLATFQMALQKGKVKKLRKARKSEKVTTRFIYKKNISAAKYSIRPGVCKCICDQARDFAGLQKSKTKARSLSRINKS